MLRLVLAAGGGTSPNANDIVWALLIANNQVYLGGEFDHVSGLVRSNLAAVDLESGQVTDWDPNPDFSLRELLLANGVLYSGGVFLRMGGQTSRGIAAFSLSSVDQPTFETGSIVRLADGRVRFRLTAPGVTQATVQGSTDLAEWGNLQTVPLIGGSLEFTDDEAPNHPLRFYRFSVP